MARKEEQHPGTEINSGGCCGNSLSIERDEDGRNNRFLLTTVSAALLLLFVPLLLLFHATSEDSSFSTEMLFVASDDSVVASNDSIAAATTTQLTTAAAVATSDNTARSEVVLITGATGRLGARLYFELQRRDQQHEVRALVRSTDKARSVLGCARCDETEGIFLGDVTDPSGLANATRDGRVTVLVIAAGASPYVSEEEQRAVEFDGVVNSVRAVAVQQSSGESERRKAPKVVLCSSMGTTRVSSPDSLLGNISHWKLNAEAFLSTAGLPSVIVKPCGLKDDLGPNYTLYTGNLDAPSEYFTIARDNVARVMGEAAVMPAKRGERLRFDLCSKPGSPTTDFKKLIEDSRWEWEK